jgi:hypothetical protein
VLVKEMLGLLKTYVEEHGEDGPFYGVLGSKMPNYVYWSKSTMETEIDADSCKVRILSASGSGRIVGRNTQTLLDFMVPLDKIDLGSIRIVQDLIAKELGRQVYLVAMNTTGSEKVISGWEFATRESGYYSAATVPFTGRDVAEQVRDGFKKVVTLCAGGLFRRP